VPLVRQPSSAGLRQRFFNGPTVHKHRKLLAHAPERLHEEISADYTDMIYAATAEDIEERRKAFLRKWRAPAPPGRAMTAENAPQWAWAGAQYAHLPNGRLWHLAARHRRVDPE